MDFWFELFDIHMNWKKLTMIAMVLNDKTKIFFQIDCFFSSSNALPNSFDYDNNVR
jgi:hypothetical protein